MNAVPWSVTDFRVVIGSTKIDFDPNKEDANREKHKYSLSSAVHFLERLILPIAQPPYLTREANDASGEVRHEHMTVDSDGHVVFFVTTMRSNETVRVISLRKASPEERAVFSHITGFKVTKPNSRFDTDATRGST